MVLLMFLRQEQSTPALLLQYPHQPSSPASSSPETRRSPTADQDSPQQLACQLSSAISTSTAAAYSSSPVAPTTASASPVVFARPQALFGSMRTQQASPDAF